MGMRQVQILEATKTTTNSVGRRNMGIPVQRIRVAAYCRVSTDGDEQLGALYLRNLIMKKKYAKIRNGCWQAFLQMKQSPERKWTNGKDFRK